MAQRSVKPYVHFADVYDQVMADVPYRLWVKYVTSIWSLHSFSPLSVLDLACGTGSASILLAEMGYQITGVDASAHMLRVAERKFKDAGLFGRFIQSDMRDFSLDEPVDAAISLFDSLNYLLTAEDCKSTYRSVFRAMKPGGLFVFDVNTKMRLAAIEDDVHVFDGKSFFLVWQDLYDTRQELWRVKLTGFIKDQGDVWHRFNEVHEERAFPLEDTRAWLEETGFQVLAIYDTCSFSKAREGTSRAYFVARKPG